MSVDAAARADILGRFQEFLNIHWLRPESALPSRSGTPERNARHAAPKEFESNRIASGRSSRSRARSAELEASGVMRSDQGASVSSGARCARSRISTRSKRSEAINASSMGVAMTRSPTQFGARTASVRTSTARLTRAPRRVAGD